MKLIIAIVSDRDAEPVVQALIAAACTAVIGLLGRVWFPQLKSID